jgi:phage protein D
MQEKLVPQCNIYIEGARVPPFVEGNILKVAVSIDPDKTDVGWIELSNDGLSLSQSDLFAEGKPVRIDLGYLSGMKTVIDGEITAVEGVFASGAQASLIVTVMTLDHRLRRGRWRRSFRKMKDSDVVRKITSEAGLAPEVEETPETHAYIYQLNQSDMHFLQQLASRNGFELGVEGKKLYFRKPQVKSGETFALKWGENLKSFRPRLTADRQVSEVEVRGWNPFQKKEIRGAARKGDVLDKMSCREAGADLMERTLGASKAVVVDMPVLTRQEADALAKSKLNAMAFHFVTGEGSCSGEPGIRPGSVLRLAGLGKRFGGKYYVRSLRHLFSKDGYITFFGVGRSAMAESS